MSAFAGAFANSLSMALATMFSSIGCAKGGVVDAAGSSVGAVSVSGVVIGSAGVSGAGNVVSRAGVGCGAGAAATSIDG